jgi:hypothetical protein
MKTCTIWGDMSSDRAYEQYPTVTVCASRAEQARARLSALQGDTTPIMESSDIFAIRLKMRKLLRRVEAQ